VNLIRHVGWAGSGFVTRDGGSLMGVLLRYETEIRKYCRDIISSGIFKSDDYVFYVLVQI
jgi:hypothetical protein